MWSFPAPYRCVRLRYVKSGKMAKEFVEFFGPVKPKSVKGLLLFIIHNVCAIFYRRRFSPLFSYTLYYRIQMVLCACVRALWCSRAFCLQRRSTLFDARVPWRHTHPRFEMLMMIAHFSFLFSFFSSFFAPLLCVSGRLYTSYARSMAVHKTCHTLPFSTFRYAWIA